MENLKMLHELVKIHPYRLYKHDKDNYQDLLYKLGEEFYKEIKNTEYSESHNMLHDFYYAIRHLDKDDAVIHIERCLGVIHEFIDIKRVLAFYEWYTGVNKLESMPRVLKYLYTQDGKYKLVLDMKTRNKCLREIDKFRIEHPEYANSFKYGGSVYSDSYRNWIENCITTT